MVDAGNMKGNALTITGPTALLENVLNDTLFPTVIKGDDTTARNVL
jgi:hypothetical protein